MRMQMSLNGVSVSNRKAHEVGRETEEGLEGRFDGNTLYARMK